MPTTVQLQGKRLFVTHPTAEALRQFKRIGANLMHIENVNAQNNDALRSALRRLREEDPDITLAAAMTRIIMPQWKKATPEQTLKYASLVERAKRENLSLRAKEKADQIKSLKQHVADCEHLAASYFKKKLQAQAKLDKLTSK